MYFRHTYTSVASLALNMFSLTVNYTVDYKVFKLELLGLSMQIALSS